jgi:hypothetical protein
MLFGPYGVKRLGLDENSSDIRDTAPASGQVCPGGPATIAGPEFNDRESVLGGLRGL